MYSRERDFGSHTGSGLIWQQMLNTKKLLVSMSANDRQLLNLIDEGPYTNRGPARTDWRCIAGEQVS